MLLTFSITFIECIDTDITEDKWATDTSGDGCWWYYENAESCGEYDDDDFQAKNMCCVCKTNV